MSSEIKKMVVGFMFCGPRVLLVQKNTPQWQNGLWNGVGGECEPTETPIDAMVREFYEETEIQTLPGDWRLFCTEFGPGYCVHFFKMNWHDSRRMPAVPSHNDAAEPLSWFFKTSGGGNPQVVGNLHWLIPLARDWRGGDPTVAKFNDDIREEATW